MILNKLYLKNFGKFRNREILLKEGINVIYGENESGKSTLHTFLMGIFFGLPRMRGRASKTDTYTRYTPWENPGWYEGAVSFTCGDKRFRLERDFQKSSEAALLFCETDGELLSVKDGDLDMLLGNISGTVYQNTLSVGQAKSRTEEGLYKELREAFGQFQGSKELRFDPEKALDILKEKRKFQEKKEAAAIEKKERAEEKIRYEMQHERREIENLEQQLETLQTRYTREKEIRMEKQSEAGRTQSRDSYEGGRIRHAALRAGGAFGAVFLFLGALLWKLPWVFLPVWMLLFLGEEILFRIIRIRRSRALLEDRKSGEAEEKRESVLSETRLEERMQMLRESLGERKTRLENLEEDYEEACGDTEEILTIRREISCILAAGERIRETAQRMENLTGGILQKKMSEIFCSLTEGKYRQVILGKDFSLQLDTGEKCLGLHQVSFGTAEQVYLAFRLACGEILCREEELPLILDEVFAMYDDKRLLRTLTWLSKRYSQILLFSCNQREIQVLEKGEIPYHRIDL